MRSRKREKLIEELDEQIELGEITEKEARGILKEFDYENELEVD
jgi:hypothetical protein